MLTPTRRLILCGLSLLLLASRGAAQERIPWETSVSEAQRRAAESNRLVLVHFWDHNCLPCEKMERQVFNRPEVIRVVATNFVPVKVNVSQNRELAERFRINRWPTDVILDPRGNELYRGVPYPDPQRFTATLDNVTTHARVGMTVPHNDRHVAWGDEANPDSAASGGGAADMRRDSRFQPPSNLHNASANSTAGQQPPPRQPIDNRYFQPQSPPPPAADPRQAGQRNAYAQGQMPPGYPQNTQGRMAPTQPPYGSQANRYAADNRPPAGSSPMHNPSLCAPRESAPGPSAAGNGNWNGRDPATTPQGQAGNMPPQLPEIQVALPQPDANGNPPLAVEGFCTVTLVEQEVWKPGDKQWGAIHRGRTYLFQDQAAQQKFLADPDRYAPVLAGVDIVRMIDQQRMVPGQRKHGVFYNKRVYLFADEAALERFWSRPEFYVSGGARLETAARN